MSDAAEKQVPRRVRVDEVSKYLQIGGDFVEEERYAPKSGGGFVPWGKTKFRNLDDIRDEPVAGSIDPVSSGGQDHVPGEPENATAVPEDAAVEHAPIEHVTIVPPPPEVAQDSMPSRGDILHEIEQAREDGRVTGYNQGLAAARQEFHDAIAVLQTIEAGILAAVQGSALKNTAVIARHVRRLAQELAGDMLAAIPDAFIERIRTASEMFSRSGAEFSLAINARDAQVLMSALRGHEVFKTVKIIEDHDLPEGGFRIVSRDLEFEDVPELADLPE
jgi:hypothetical protein